MKISNTLENLYHVALIPIHIIKDVMEGIGAFFKWLGMAIMFITGCALYGLFIILLIKFLVTIL